MQFLFGSQAGLTLAHWWAIEAETNNRSNSKDTGLYDGSERKPSRIGKQFLH